MYCAQQYTNLRADTDRDIHFGAALMPHPYPRDAVRQQERYIHPEQQRTSGALNACGMTLDADCAQQEDDKHASDSRAPKHVLRAHQSVTSPSSPQFTTAGSGENAM